ncbi:MAG: TIGR01244 family sulfur transferase [Aliishimia sp.]
MSTVMDFTVGKIALMAIRYWTHAALRLIQVAMDIRKITENYYVAPQMDPSEMTELAKAGFATVICNRPDAEVPPSHQADALEAAAQAAGLDFHRLALTHQTMNPPNIARQRGIVDVSSGKVLAYCASGTRSTIAWALGQVGSMSTDDILSAAQAGGYQLDNIRPTLDAMASDV